MRELIFLVVENFYQKVTMDVLIGYHFDKFNEPSVLGPHLQRISSFWEMQLTGATSVPLDQGKPFHLLFTHLQLKLKRGELGRWIVLFHKTLDELASSADHPNMGSLIDLWKNRIAFFEERFKSHPQMFQ